MSASHQRNYSPDDPVATIPLVGPSYESKLERMGIRTIADLVTHYPFRYEDTRNITSIDALRLNGEGTISARIDAIANTRTRSGRILTKARISDETGSISAVWFNQPYLTKTLTVGENYLFSGKTNSKWGGVSLTNPKYERYEGEHVHLGKISPIYPTTYGVSSKWLRARLKTLEPYIDDLVLDHLPHDILEKENLVLLNDAVRKIHFPVDEEDIEEARERLGLDELVHIRIEANKTIHEREQQKAFSLDIDNATKFIEETKKNLPFTLTKPQTAALDEIVHDLSKEKPMYRLLNGDVGSGKTIVALLAAASFHREGYTTVIMAPTTILAQQHYESITETLNTLGISIPVSLHTSGSKQDIEDTPQIIIGTHALLFKESLPAKTALVVVDEQHRFGVVQRQKILELTTSERKHPHYLTMTATPIPRTLTMAIYGSTNVFIIDELPPGRIPVKSHVVPNDKRDDAYAWIRDKISEGDQVFVLCPLVEESEKVQATAAKDEHTRLSKEIFTSSTVGLIHGQMKERDKDEVLKRFREGKTDILVATPVIEVGIDIPNATIMLIEDAGRFGLAQLHQLRGRIGRGSKQSYCFLFTEASSPDVGDRLNFFASHSSGFDVAEYDLKRRGPGEVYGIRQSGLLSLRFADISDTKLMTKADRIVQQIANDVL